MQEDFGAIGPKHLLHPLLTTLGIFEGSGPCSRHSGSQDQNSDHGEFEPPEFKSTVNLYRKKETQTMVRVSSLAKLRPWSELTAEMVMGVVPGLVISVHFLQEKRMY